jgi:class 3 adenylate cyclase/tetratricopeptide (TPR) repeat protein
MLSSARVGADSVAMNVAKWLADLGLGQYEAAFATNAIDDEVLRQLTAEDLTELGITAIGHRRKLLDAIARLAPAAPASASALAVPANGEPVGEGAQGDHRHVAVLFADLVGYTSLTEQLGAEAMHALLDAYFRTVDSVVERMGGRVDKHIGDCVMAVFGAPIAHDNDAERAVRAAIEIRDAVRALAAERGQAIAVHVGVTMGYVVASTIGAGRSAEYAITGESVNLASRLTDAAGKDEILIADGLFRALAGKLESERFGDLAMKGFGKPVPTWRLVGLREASIGRRPIVGRRRELRQFEAVLRGCLDEGAGQVILLRGEAGIGKTLLNEQFEHLAQAAGFAGHRGVVLDFGAETGRDAVRAIVRGLLNLDRQTRGEALTQAARDAVANGAVSPECAVHLNDLLDLPQPEELRARYDAMDNQSRQQGRELTIAQVVGWAADRQARLLIVEDVHWAKAPLLRALACVARAVAACPAILVVTTRIEGDPLDKSWRAGIGGTPLTTVDLGPLPAEDARQLCVAEGADPAAVAPLIERAGGNPLFLEQLLRHAGEGDASKVPGTIQSLVQATVDQLSPADRSAIQAAAVIGQRVDLELLGHLTGRPGPVGARLVDQGLLRPQGQEMLFGHALIRDAVYQSLLTTTRTALHRRAAQWLEQRDNLRRAEHLALAEAPEAAAAFLAAANESIERYHLETALSLLDRGLALARTAGDEVALLLLKGQTLHDLGRLSEAEPAYHRALAVAATGIERSQALIGLAAVKRLTDDIDGALTDLAQAESEASANNLLVEQSRIQFLRGNLMFPRGDFDRCLREHQEGLRFAQLAARPDLQAASLGGLGDAEYLRGRMNSSRQRLVQCVALARELGLGRIEVANQAQVAHTMLYTGPLDEMLAVATAAVEAAMQVGHLRATINAGVAVAAALLGLARYDECLEMVKEAEEVIERAGAHRFRQPCLLFRGRALAALGRKPEAIQTLRDGIAFATENGFAFHGPSLLGALAVVSGDPAEKAACLDRAEAGLAEGSVSHNHYRVYADGVDVAYALRDPAMLRRYVDFSRRYPSDETVAWSAFHALRGEALLHQLESGASPEAALLFRQAAQRSRELSLHHYRVTA